tara:strand:- start:798 stop:2309 length:1512 start_codon:yes stop_codon:yes gene_type:complete
VVPGGTSSSSSGAYISAAAWEEGGVLTKSGRGNDMGELPKTVDITGGNYGSFEIPAQQPGTFQYGNEYGDGDPHGGGHGRDPIDDPTGGNSLDYVDAKGCPCEAWQIGELGLQGGAYVYDPRCCPESSGLSPDTPLTSSVPCCEPCTEKKGWWRRCRKNEEDNTPCIYPTISDCELVDKKNKLTIQLRESELINLIEKTIIEQESGVEGGGVESGISDAGGTGAKTWDSGVSRGPGNPAGGGVTHWADTYTINRGKGNPLFESKWYNTLLDVVGIVDPTGVADGINAISYFKQGDLFYGLLSLVSLVPYAGDVIAKPIMGAMKLGKFGGKAVNGAMKSGSASKVASEMGKTKMGKTFLDGFKNSKVTGFLSGLLAKIGKVPGFGKLAKDGQTYVKLFTNASKLSATGAKMRVFRKSGGLLTRMQRKGLLNRTKLYTKFAVWLTGIGVAEEALGSMPEEEVNEKFTEYAATPEGQEDIMNMPESEKLDFIKILKDILADKTVTT